MKKRTVGTSSRKVLSLFWSVEDLEGRCLLSAISVDRGDVYRSVAERDFDEFIPATRKGVISLDCALDASSEYGNTLYGDDFLNGTYTEFEQSQLAAAQIELSGSLVGRIDHFGTYVDTSVSMASVYGDNVGANENTRNAYATLSISGWGRLDLDVHAWASTSGIWNEKHGSFVSGVSSTSNEVDDQATEGRYHIKTNGKFDIWFFASASAGTMTLGVNLTPDQDFGTVAWNRSEVLLDLRATRYDLNGYTRTDTRQEEKSDDSDYVYSAFADNDVYGKGRGEFFSLVDTLHENRIGYDGGKSWSNNVGSYMSVRCDVGGKGGVTYYMEANYDGSFSYTPDRTVKFNLGEHQVIDNNKITQGGGSGVLLDQLYADYLELKLILSPPP